MMMLEDHGSLATLLDQKNLNCNLFLLFQLPVAIHPRSTLKKKNVSDKGRKFFQLSFKVLMELYPKLRKIEANSCLITKKCL